MDTGSPCMVYKDACNRKSNQQNAGTLKCSGLCCEIMGFTSVEETLASVQASISLPMFVTFVDGQRRCSEGGGSSPAVQRSHGR